MHTLDDTDRCCSSCDTIMEPVSEKTSEQLDIIRAQVQVIRYVRKTYVCRTCGNTPKTTAPPQPIPKSQASPGTLAHIAVRKSVDSLLLYRQEQQLKRIDIDRPGSTLAGWMIKAGMLDQLLINLMRDIILNYDISTMDETRLQVL